MPSRRSRSRSHEREKSRRDLSYDGYHKKHGHGRSHDAGRYDAKRSKHVTKDINDPASQKLNPKRQEGGSDVEKKRLRLEKLAAWKARKPGHAANGAASAPDTLQPSPDEPSARAAATTPAVAECPAQPDGLASSQPAWTPWDDPACNTAAAPAPEEAQVAASTAPQSTARPSYMAMPAVPKSVAKRRAQFEVEQSQKQYKKQMGMEDDGDDALDAFMAAEIMPEVSAKEEAARLRQEEERKRKVALLAAGKRLPVDQTAVGDSDSEEEIPDEEFEIPAHKVKLMIGAGGEKIKLIQRKSKARIQVKKDQKELTQAFGTGPKFNIPVRGVQKTEEGSVKMVTVMLFGDKEQRRKARELIDEAIENREQKAKQRHQQAERKREVKARDRQLYHLRHTRDYEALGVPIGTDKAGIKKAYRNLAKIWHPDKHPDNQQEAKLKFQEIARAFDALMTTDEDAQILSLAGNSAADKRAAHRSAAAAGVRMRPETL